MADSNIPVNVDTWRTQPSALRMYAAVMGVGVACALAIVIVYETTRPVIQRNRIALRQQAILDVLPAAQASVAFQLNQDGQFERVSADSFGWQTVFAGFDEQDKLVGIAIEAEGMGYQDVVRVLYGYSIEKQAIVGLRVLQTRETPGLGDRIESDPAFLRNFDNLDVRLASDGSRLAHAIEFVKPGKKHSAWQIDGISGATITSRATANMLRQSAARWIPLLYRQRLVFDRRAAADSEKPVTERGQ